MLGFFSPAFVSAIHIVKSKLTTCALKRCLRVQFLSMEESINRLEILVLATGSNMTKVLTKLHL